MKAVRALVVVLATLTVGSAWDRWPTGVAEPPGTSLLVSASSSQTGLIGPTDGTIGMGPHCPTRKVKLSTRAYDRRSNYAVAW